jgi:hypothetical protein
MRAPHDYFGAGGSDGVGHPVRAGRHTCHGTDANQLDVVSPDVIGQLDFIHRLGITVDKKYFVSWRCQRLKQKHPEMRHEVMGHTIIRIVEKNIHSGYLILSV